MSRGSKAKYTEKQKRKAEHIEKGYEEKGVSAGRAAQIAWATVNKQSGGGERSGSGRHTSSAAKSSARKDSAKKAVATRQKKGRVGSLENQSKQELLEKARQKNISGRSSMNKEELILAFRRPNKS